MGHTTTTYPSDHEYVTMSANTIRPQGLCRRDQPGLDAEEIYRVSSPTWFSVSVQVTGQQTEVKEVGVDENGFVRSPTRCYVCYRVPSEGRRCRSVNSLYSNATHLPSCT